VTALLAALALLGPVVVHDARETSPLAAVERSAPAAVYERRAGPWRQWWLYFEQNDQDRGILRTGRHAGDWEMVQIRDDAGGRPVEAVYAQHSGAERCPWAAVETRAGRPVIYLANGSHAAYFRPGVRERTFPEPNDEAGGDGLAVRPRVEPISEDAPAWMRRREPWGGARAGWFPGEQGSPLGPAFQPQGRWSDPDAWARAARPCTFDRCDELGECDVAETATAIGAGLLAIAVLGFACQAIVLRGRPRLRRV